MTSPTFELCAERVTLRHARPGDAAAIASYRSLPEVARFQSWTTFDEADAARMLDEQVGLGPDVPGSWFQLVIVDATSGTVAGDLAIHFRADDRGQVEVGVNVAPHRQGRGLASEAIRRVLGYLFDTLGKHRVVAIADADNEAVARLFRRLAFRQEGHCVEHVRYKGGWGSEYLFAMLAHEWRARSQATPAHSGHDPDRKVAPGSR